MNFRKGSGGGETQLAWSYSHAVILVDVPPFLERVAVRRKETSEGEGNRGEGGNRDGEAEGKGKRKREESRGVDVDVGEGEGEGGGSMDVDVDVDMDKREEGEGAAVFSDWHKGGKRGEVDTKDHFYGYRNFG